MEIISPYLTAFAKGSSIEKATRLKWFWRVLVPLKEGEDNLVIIRIREKLLSIKWSNKKFLQGFLGMLSTNLAYFEG